MILVVTNVGGDDPSTEERFGGIGECTIEILDADHHDPRTVALEVLPAVPVRKRVCVDIDAEDGKEFVTEP
jgi:hypothetical protein